ncbi:hypothetical protein PS710_02861 [Pseudomonas fluorescens]|uniref:Uncharacterized protein n=1 Tax=Pseudomonas fluorescens TaxID=294 RepID=A0A5E7CN70_PSEFL|nr:hypothetical protein PS710_02861 [Pseudomonas fluorescens]
MSGILMISDLATPLRPYTTLQELACRIAAPQRKRSVSQHLC